MAFTNIFQEKLVHRVYQFPALSFYRFAIYQSNYTWKSMDIIYLSAWLLFDFSRIPYILALSFIMLSTHGTQYYRPTRSKGLRTLRSRSCFYKYCHNLARIALFCNQSPMLNFIWSAVYIVWKWYRTFDSDVVVFFGCSGLDWTLGHIFLFAWGLQKLVSKDQKITVQSLVIPKCDLGKGKDVFSY